MKKAFRIILALLFLFFLSSFSFTLARYSRTTEYDITLVSAASTVSSDTKNPEPSVDVTPKFISEGEYGGLYIPGKGEHDKKVETIAEDGVYLIQLWGANGGPPSYQQGEYYNFAGAGGYVLALGEFKAGDTITIKSGQIGCNEQIYDSDAGRAGSAADIWENGGMAGGGSSSLKVKRGEDPEIMAMIAGGGGGSGPLYKVGNDGGNGGDVTAVTPIQSGSLYIYAGTDGKAEADSQVGAKGGIAGSQATNKGGDSPTIAGGGGGGGYRGGGGGENRGGGGGGSSMVDTAAGLSVGRADSALMKTLENQVSGLPVARLSERPKPGIAAELYHGGYRLIKLEGSTYEEFKAAFE